MGLALHCTHPRVGGFLKTKEPSDVGHFGLFNFETGPYRTPTWESSVQLENMTLKRY